MFADIAPQLKTLLGPTGYIDDPAEIAPFLEEWRSKFHGHSPALLKPACTADVSTILKLCSESRTPLVPQGGNTGLVGGQIPADGEALLSLSRLRAIHSVDVEGACLVAEAGVILADAQKAAAEHDLLLPLSMAAEGSCTIGGVVSANAGGVNVLRYGMARDQVLGLEVVLADGTVLDMLRTLRKDNTGYDLKQMFIGAEGTLGIVTAAAWKLSPMPQKRATAFLAVPGIAAAAAVLKQVQRATGGMVTAFELVPRDGLALVLRHIAGTSDPFATPAPWYVLCEVSGAPSLQETMEEALAGAMEDGLALDAVIAASEAQRLALWRLRECLSDAEKTEGPSLKHDVSVPLADMAAFVDQALKAVKAAEPGLLAIPFGHLGDGNLHFNFVLPRGSDAQSDRWEKVSQGIYRTVRVFHGSISAEHGIGVLKRDELARSKSSQEIALMRTLKSALDPLGILNPGKLLP